MKYLTFLFFILMPVLCDAQIISPFKVEKGEIITYKQLSDSFKKDNQYVDGDYFILVSAEWCAPCQELKQRLKENNLFGKKIAFVDLDEDGKLSAKLMAPRQTIPQLIRYRITENGKKIVKSFRDSESLEDFFKK